MTSRQTVQERRHNTGRNRVAERERERNRERNREISRVGYRKIYNKTQRDIHRELPEKPDFNTDNRTTYAGLQPRRPQQGQERPRRQNRNHRTWPFTPGRVRDADALFLHLIEPDLVSGKSQLLRFSGIVSTTSIAIKKFRGEIFAKLPTEAAACGCAFERQGVGGGSRSGGSGGSVPHPGGEPTTSGELCPANWGITPRER